MAITLKTPETDPLPAIETLGMRGYPVTLLDPALPDSAKESGAASKLLRYMAVAGFGAANIMLLSVSVWAGAEGASRQMFHMISALIWLPIVVYSGRPFFASALGALRGRHLNMDAPI